ncbi:hypothetical protein HMPREF1987_01214 [Peptostreptococcaceae bacterium oral taxon 113 str. W5053]|nr:hypothetical protein HMPREF1987_01214 [Peptostreptococcaceae bacterium oral taxon 113 str. W5053]
MMLINTENVNFLIRGALLLLVVLICYYLIHIGNRYVNTHHKIVFDRKKVLAVALTLAIIVLIVYLFSKYAILGRMIMVLIISGVVAYILNPAVDFFERKKIKRIWAILLVYLIILGVLFLIGLSVAPKIIEEVKNFFLYLPKNVTSFLNSVWIWSEKFLKTNPGLQDYVSKVNEALKEAVYKLQANLVSIGGNLTDYAKNALSHLLNVILIPVVAFYYLKDKEKIKASLIKKIPEGQRESWLQLGCQIDASMGQFIQGRLLMAVFVGVATAIVLWILGVNYAVVIGAITCIADIIPYIGPLLGFLPAVIIAFIQQPMKALWVGIAFVLIQWVENNLVGPKLLGDSTGLHPLTVLLCLIIGGGMFGVLGMIFSVPVVAIVKIFWDRFFPVVKGYFSEK